MHGDRGRFFPSTADHEEDWHPYLVDPYFAICDDHTINTRVIDHTNSGCGKREAYINWSMVACKLAAPVTGTNLENY